MHTKQLCGAVGYCSSHAASITTETPFFTEELSLGTVNVPTAGGETQQKDADSGNRLQQDVAYMLT